MTQLELFEQEENKPNEIDLLPYFHRTTGGGNINDFLQTYRNYQNTIVSKMEVIECGKRKVGFKILPLCKIEITRYRLCDFNSTNDIPTVKSLLFTFNRETKEYEHKTIYNFRINQMLHNIYDFLSERSNND